MSFIRDPWTAAMVPHNVSPMLGDDRTSDPRFWYGQLHALALAIYQAQRRAEAARAAGTLDMATAEVENVANLRRAFQDVAAKFLLATEDRDPTALAAVDRIVLVTGTWVSNFMAALPGALAAIPKAVLASAGDIGVAAGMGLFRVTLPVVATGLVALWFLARAERSRVVRRAFA